MPLSLLQKLLKPCQGSSPVGENLEYSPAFLEMMSLSERTPEQQYGDAIQAAREPDWAKLLSSSVTVAESTRDLRVAVRIIDSLCHTGQWSGLAFGLKLVANWVTEYWDAIYPELDSDDNLDPTSRLSVLSYLVNDDLLLNSIQNLPLLVHRTVGTISLRDYRVLFQANENASPWLSRGEIDAAFMNEPIEGLRTQKQFIDDCIVSFDTLDSFLVEKVGIHAWSGTRLREILDYASTIHDKYVTLISQMSSAINTPLEVSHGSIAPISTTENSNSVVAFNATSALGQSPIVQTVTRGLSQVTSRAEAAAALDSVCTYFEQNEPASPVPLLLQRAKRLIPMSFAEILRELSPSEGSNLLQHLMGSEDSRR